MKKFLILVFLFVNLFSSEDLNWIDFKQLYSLSSDNIIEKPVLLFVGSSQCKYCEHMKEKMNSNEDFKQFLRKNYTFVYVKQDIDFLPVDYYSEFTPTFYILNPKTLSLLVKDKAIGDIELDRLKDWLSKISDLYSYYLIKG